MPLIPVGSLMSRPESLGGGDVGTPLVPLLQFTRALGYSPVQSLGTPCSSLIVDSVHSSRPLAPARRGACCLRARLTLRRAPRVRTVPEERAPLALSPASLSLSFSNQDIRGRFRPTGTDLRCSWLSDVRTRLAPRPSEQGGPLCVASLAWKSLCGGADFPGAVTRSLRRPL